jgi:tripartite-type tricarboxylate transporter receptor subunit TctC
MTLAPLLATASAFLFVASAHAQSYPDKPIRLITSEAGGGNDVQARLIATALSMRLNQRIVVDNRPSGVIPGDITAKAAPDGYTLLFYNNALWTASLLQKTPYDAMRDLAPVAWPSSTPNVLVVNADVPAKSVPELIALARAKPGELNYASSGTGASNHLAGELFKSMAGVNIVRIAYKGAAQGMNDVVGGRVQVMFPTSVAATPFVKSGKVRALAVTSLRPSALAPGLPTIAASGLPGYESIAIYGMFAPTGTPRAVIALLNREIERVLTTPELKEKFLNIGMEPAGGPPEALTAKMKEESARVAKLVRTAGIRPE